MSPVVIRLEISFKIVQVICSVLFG